MTLKTSAPLLAFVVGTVASLALWLPGCTSNSNGTGTGDQQDAAAAGGGTSGSTTLGGRGGNGLGGAGGQSTGGQGMNMGGQNMNMGGQNMAGNVGGRAGMNMGGMNQAGMNQGGAAGQNNNNCQAGEMCTGTATCTRGCNQNRGQRTCTCTNGMYTCSDMCVIVDAGVPAGPVMCPANPDGKDCQSGACFTGADAGGAGCFCVQGSWRCGSLGGRDGGVAMCPANANGEPCMQPGTFCSGGAGMAGCVCRRQNGQNTWNCL